MFHVSNLPAVPSPTTCCCLRDLVWFGPGAYRAACRSHPLCGTLASIGLHHSQVVSHNSRPNRVRHPTDQRFTSSCSPPPLARTQLLSVTKFRPTSTRTFTLLIRYTYKRTSRHTPCAVRYGTRSVPATFLATQSHSPILSDGGRAFHGRRCARVPSRERLCHRSFIHH